MRLRTLLDLIGALFCLGALAVGAGALRVEVRALQDVPREIGTSGHVAPGVDPQPPVPRPAPSASPNAPSSLDGVEALKRRDLAVPIEGADVSQWKGAFYQRRAGHRHEAVDLMAPRDTPIRAVDAGVIARLFSSKAGGLTIYQRDPTSQFMYYYAHLERYADIREGQAVERGQVLGYVGSSGNARADAPHLHFAIFKLGDPRRWWEGTALDPYEVYGGSAR